MWTLLSPAEYKETIFGSSAGILELKSWCANVINACSNNPAVILNLPNKSRGHIHRQIN